MARMEGHLLFAWILERDIMTPFLNGIHQETKVFLLNEDETESDAILKAAIWYETARTSRSQGQIHAVQPTGGADQTAANLRGKIKALEQKISKLLSAPTSQSSQTGQRRQSGPPDISSLPNGFCHYCSIEGHKKDECRKMAKDKAKGCVQQFHDNFVNGGKKRQKRPFQQGNSQQSSNQVAELTVTHPAQPVQPGQASAAAAGFPQAAA